MFNQRILLPNSLLYITGLALFIVFLAPVAVTAAVPQIKSDKSYLLVVAALGDVGRGAESGSALKDYRVRRQRVEDYEFADAVLAIMLKNIDIADGREAIIRALNLATPGQKALYAVQIMRITVNDVGFIGFLESDYGNLIPEVKRGLKVLGAKEYLKLLETAIKVFEKENSLITETRNRKEILNRLSNEQKYSIFDPVDQKFESFEDKTLLQGYIIKYVNSNPKHFFVK